MVYIINQLPQNISGSSTSGEQPVYFYKEEIDQTQVQEISLNQKMIFSTITHTCSYSYTTDHPGNPLPISIIVGGGVATFFYPEDSGTITLKQVNWNSEISLNNGLQFANIGLLVFIQQEQYFYSCDLSQTTPTITRREDIYNTTDGTSSGTVCSNCMLGVLFDHYLVSMGGSQRGIRFFYSYEEGGVLKIRFANIYNGGNQPYGYGTCVVIAKDTIFGGFTTYSGNTGYNVLYHCTEDTQGHTIAVSGLIHPILDNKNFPTADNGTKHLLIVWKGKMCCMYTSTSTSTINYKLVSYQGSGRQITLTGSTTALGYRLSFALASNTYYYYNGGNTPTITKGILSIQEEQVMSTEQNLYTLSTNSVFCKIPGMSAYYYDGDKTQDTSQPILGFSYDPTASLFLPTGSAINHIPVQDHHITFPKSGEPITLQISSNALNFHLLQDRGDGTGGML